MEDEFFSESDTTGALNPATAAKIGMNNNRATIERLVVFDFDNTIYAAKEWGRMSCDLMECPFFQLADGDFMGQVVKGFHAAGIPMGVASFGKKKIIIECMNALLYGPGHIPQLGAYFHEGNVITVPDVQAHWKVALNKISSTFKGYVKRSAGDVDAAFAKFLEDKSPHLQTPNTKRYWCMKLHPSAKLDMIEIIRTFYNKTEREPIQLSEVRYFDDDAENVDAAHKAGVMAHHVPLPGITRAWWEKECIKTGAQFPEPPPK